MARCNGRLIAIGVICALCGMPHNSALYAQRTKTSLRAGEQRKAEKGLKDNRYFFYFIDSSVSNFGSEEEKKLFKEAIQRDVLAQLLYMRFQFKESFDEIRKSQKLLVELYGITLRKDIAAAKNLLDETAPGVINSKDEKARTYLRLGYRSMKNAQTNCGMGDNYQERLYSMRLLQYVKAIKMAKEGRRYAFLAMIESSIPEVEKSTRRMTFDSIEKELLRTAPADKTELYRQIHRDNYYIITGGASYYDQIWDRPELQDLEEYTRYLQHEQYPEE